MSNNPFRSPFQTVINIFVGIIVFVVGFNIMMVALDPYLDMVGKVLSTALIVFVVILAIIAVGALLVRIGFWDWLRDRTSRNNRRFNG